jgi:hypothetical protein
LGIAGLEKLELSAMAVISQNRNKQERKRNGRSNEKRTSQEDDRKETVVTVSGG